LTRFLTVTLHQVSTSRGITDIREDSPFVTQLLTRASPNGRSNSTTSVNNRRFRLSYRFQLAPYSSLMLDHSISYSYVPCYFNPVTSAISVSDSPLFFWTHLCPFTFNTIAAYYS